MHWQIRFLWKALQQIRSNSPIFLIISKYISLSDVFLMPDRLKFSSASFFPFLVKAN